MKRDILLIESDDRHRVALVRALLRQAYRVTLCSSLEEADEIPAFVRVLNEYTQHIHQVH